VRAKAAIRRAVHRDLREHGLTGSQLDILRVLAESGTDGTQLNDISQRLYVTSGNVTGLIDRLEEAGYLARVPHPQDRRITRAVLTPAGRELFERLHPPYLDRIKSLMSSLTAKEQAVLADLLGRVADRAAEMDG
jgi:MarR family 2-MHQ and catechol resistance regulon transcriptional repressor